MSRISMPSQVSEPGSGTIATPAATTSLDKIRLLIVDDHPIVRFGLTALLSLQGDIEMAGTAESGRAALELLGKAPIDVILIDLRMPGFSGIETLQGIREIAPATRSIVLSSFEFDEEIYAAVKAGAKGYIH